MPIKRLSELEHQTQWIEFCQSAPPYCFVKQPEALVDFQTNWLKITLLKGVQPGDSAQKYSLGSRLNREPAWALIKACHWRLSEIIKGLESLEFSSNVKENALRGVHTDLTLRKSFAREPFVSSLNSIGIPPPLNKLDQVTSGEQLIALLVHQQYQDLTIHPDQQAVYPDLPSLRLAVVNTPQLWRGRLHQGRLHLFEGRNLVGSLTPFTELPKPRLLAGLPFEQLH